MNTLLASAPLAVIVGAVLLILLVDAFSKGRSGRRFPAPIGAIALAANSVLGLRSWGKACSYFGGRLLLDDFSIVFLVLIAMTGVLIILIGLRYVPTHGMDTGAFHALLLLAISGAVIMVSSLDLIVIFLGLEVLSVASYALAGLKRDDPRSAESAIKYFMTGSLAGAFLIFGLAFLYGAAGSLDVPAILAALRRSPPSWTALAGSGLFLAAFGFKIAIVPFHMWAPDVYEGAPTPVTAFFSVVPKAAGLAVLMRLLAPFWVGAGRPEQLRWLLGAAAALTMIVGNLAALRQRNIKRILAYSSIAHTGYALIAVVSGDGPGLAFYLVVYAFMNIGAFSAVVALGHGEKERLDLDEFAGTGLRSPWIGAMLSVFLLSLAGFPPTGGFLAKFLVFGAAVERGLNGLVIIAVLASLVSVYYYLRVIVVMYMRPPLEEVGPEDDQPGVFLALFFCLYAVLQLGIAPGNILAFIKQAMNF